MRDWRMTEPTDTTAELWEKEPSTHGPAIFTITKHIRCQFKPSSSILNYFLRIYIYIYL